MALVGEAHIVVRAITDSISKDIQKGFSGASSAGSKAGDTMGQAFTKGFNKNVNQNTFSRIADGLKSLSPGAEAARSSFLKLLASGFTLQTALSTLVGSIGAVIGGIGALGGSAGGAIASLASLGNVLFTLGSAMAVAKLALGGVSKALSALNKPASGGGGGAGAGAAAAKAQAAADAAVQSAEKSLARTIEDNRESLVTANNDVRDAQEALNKAFADGREQIQQLGFDAEDAALSESKAGLALEDARKALAKAQDLPPNSRVRQEAELAYQEADLNYRKAKDASDDLNKQQDQLAKTGVKGTDAVINATNALAQAEANKSKTVRDAARSEADAQDNLAKAKQNAATAGDSGGSSGGGGADPYAGLNQAQIDFVNFIQSLKPQFEELKKIAAESFLPPLTTAIKLLSTQAFPTFATGIGIVGAALGQAAISIAQAIVQGQNLDNLGKLFAAAGPLLITMGKGLGSLYGAILSILVVTAPIAQKFFDFLADRLATFDGYLKSVEGNKALVTFFDNAEKAMEGFGTIFGNIFKGFGQIIQANLGPGTGGGYLIQYLSDATGKFAALDGSARGKNTLSQYFLDASKNLTKILGFLGQLLSVFGSLGADQNIGKTFDIFKGALPYLKDFVKQGIDAGPAFAGAVVAIAKLVDKLSDLGALKVFFDTVTSVVNVFVGILSNPLVNAIATIHGRFIAFTAVFSILGTVGAFAFKVLVGGLTHIIGPIGTAIGAFGELAEGMAIIKGGAGTVTETFGLLSKSTNPLVGALGSAGGAFSKLGGILKVAFTGPVGIVLGIIALLVGAFILLYKTSDTFKAQMDAIFKQLSDVFSTAFTQIMAAVQPLIPILSGALMTIIKALVPLLTMLANVFAQIITAIVPIIPLLIGALVPALTAIITAIVPIVSTLIGELVPVFSTLIAAIMPLVTTLISSLMPVLKVLFDALGPLIGILADSLGPVLQALTPLFKVAGDVIQIVITIISALIQTIVDLLTGNFSDLGKVWSDAWNSIKDTVMDILNNLFAFFQTIWQAIVDFFTTAFQIYVQIWTTVFTSIYNFVSTIFNNIVSFFQTVIGNIVGFFVNGFNGLVGFVASVFGTISNTIRDIFNGILSTIKGIINGIIGAVEGMVNAVINAINGLSGGIRDAIGAVAGALGIKVNIGAIPKVHLPRLAAGGTVFPSAGGSIVNVAEAGKPERIEPLDENGLSKRDKALIDFMSNGSAGGTTINIYPTEGMSIQELAAEVDRRISFRMRKGGTT